ncbi:MAG TPA: hypothetical protein VMZ33_02350 [Candidatus Limnocylindrales bacterium]|nr:hypothetical protein [Candidatus Limnocylindrales bacterium]
MVEADGSFFGATGLAGTFGGGGWALGSDLASGEPPILEPGGASVTATAVVGTVYALAVSGNNLYVGGEFENVAGIPEADYIARWDGTAWSALGSNGAGNGALDAGVRAIAIHGSNVVVGGFFNNVAGIAGADYVARWTGTSWAPLQNLCCGAAAINNSVHALAVQGDFVYAGGYFTDAGGFTGVNYIARWSVPCDCWSAVGPAGSMTGPVFAIGLGASRLYVGGLFDNAGGKQFADNVAFLSGNEWWHMGSGVNGPVFALLVFRPTEFDEHVYVGGGFTNVGGATGDYLARFDSLDWYPVGSNGAGDGALNDSVYTLTLVNGSLFVGGTFEDAGGNVNADSGARWSGSAWFPLAAGFSALNSHVFALAPSSNGLYIGGHFTDAGGQAEADRVVLRKGSEWIPLSPRRPDGRIRLRNGAFVGNNVYNGTGVNQTRTGSAAPGQVIMFGISAQNDSAIADRIRVGATGTSVSGYTIKYFTGSTDVTLAVNSGTYQTPVLPAGGSVLITAKVTVKQSAADGSSISRLVTLRSVADQTKLDVLKLVAQRT